MNNPGQRGSVQFWQACFLEKENNPIKAWNDYLRWANENNIKLSSKNWGLVMDLFLMANQVLSKEHNK